MCSGQDSRGQLQSTLTVLKRGLGKEVGVLIPDGGTALQEARHHAGEGPFTMSSDLHPQFHTIDQGYHTPCQDSLLPKSSWSSSLLRHSSTNNHTSPYSSALVGAGVAFYHFPSWRSWQDNGKMNGSHSFQIHPVMLAKIN